ncbi:MAG: glycoside hydrolase family 108 protein [Massilia sp.]|jgi:lysozyme family protein
MKDTLSHALQLIAASEGGWSDNPADPGGATMRGITQRTLSAYLGRQVSKDELRAISDETWGAIMASQYADPIAYADLPAGLDYCALDASTNSGPARAGRLLQQALGFTGPNVDGVVGHHTLDAVGQLTPDRVRQAIRDFCTARLDYMKTLKTWGTFGHGWAARVEAVQTEALTVAEGLHPPGISVHIAMVPDAASAKAFGPTKLIAIPSGQAVLATAGTAAVTVGAVAAQVTTALQPYGEHRFVHWLLLAAAIATAISSAVMTLITKSRADSGATS